MTDPALNDSGLAAVATTDKRRARSERTRANLLDAAMHCYRELGVNNTAMEDVANQAGVGRATLYRHFANQDLLLTQVMSRNLQEIQMLLKEALKQCDKTEDFFVEAAVLIIKESRKRNLTELLFGERSAASRISFSDPGLNAMGGELIAPFYRRAKDEGLLRDWVTQPLLQEWTSRLLLSFLTNPSPQLNSDKKLRDFFHQAIIPSIMHG